MKSLQVISGFMFMLCLLLLLCTFNGLTLTFAQKLSAPLTVSSASGLGVFLYNPALRTIACPLDYSNEVVMIPSVYFNSTMLWNVYQDTNNGNYYIIAASPSAAGCPSGTNAYWTAATPGGALSTTCSNSESSGTPFQFYTGAKSTNYVIEYAGNTGNLCLQIISGTPTLSTSACNTLIAATQWQLVTIS